MPSSRNRKLEQLHIRNRQQVLRSRKWLQEPSNRCSKSLALHRSIDPYAWPYATDDGLGNRNLVLRSRKSVREPSSRSRQLVLRNHKSAQEQLHSRSQQLVLRIRRKRFESRSHKELEQQLHNRKEPGQQLHNRKELEQARSMSVQARNMERVGSTSWLRDEP